MKVGYMSRPAKPAAKWNKVTIQTLLATNPRAVEKALVVIYNNQTNSEQHSDSTEDANGIGFSGVHARSGSYYAKWVISGKHLDGKHLEKARKIAMKYHRQLIAAIPAEKQA
jgi:hypothetical protein